MESSIQWFIDRQGRVTYSMVSRNGPSSYDCSSAVYYALKQGGLLPSNTGIGNTDSLFRDLEKNGWVKVQPNTQGNYDTKRGDVFIWGKRGASGGAAGHTGEFVDANRVIHCSSGYNGIHTDNYDQLRGWNAYPEQTFYRYTGQSQPSVGDTDQNVDVGSFIKLNQIYTANDVQQINGIWQVKTDLLCPVDFTWDDNGIPAEPLVEVDAEGYATRDQDLNIGSTFKLPGRFQILDLGLSKGIWMGQIEWNGLKFWIDINTATEILASDAGTPVPQTRPVIEPPVQPPVVTPPEILLPPVTLEPVTPPKEPEAINPPKEIIMAFSPEQQKDLAIATQSVLNANEYAPVISEKVKTIAYFATDITAIVSGLVFTLLAILGFVDAIIAITINATVTTALLGLKQTFRLSNKKQ